MTQYKIRVNLITYSHVDVDIQADSKDDALDKAVDFAVFDELSEQYEDEVETGDIEILEEVEDSE